jgi:DNA-binding SARP family transcriptional activator
MGGFEVISSRDGVARLHLLGGPPTRQESRTVQIPQGSQRLAAYLALHGHRVDRRLAAAVLWPEVSDTRAAGNLRSAMWRLRSCSADVITSDVTDVMLRPEVAVDLDDVRAWASRVTTGTVRDGDLDLDPATVQALDLLPGWYDEWVCTAREQLRLLLLRAMDALVELLVQADRCAQAVEAALDAVHVEPLRESTQRALITAHLAEGNRCEAWRSFTSYDQLLTRELGVHAPSELRVLVTSPSR